jgi:hypothetical protein
MKSSRCPLVACSDVMGSSVTDILGAAEALAPAVIGAAIGSQIRETGPRPFAAPVTRFFGRSTNRPVAFTWERIRHEWVRRRARPAPNA